MGRAHPHEHAHGHPHGHAHTHAPDPRLATSAQGLRAVKVSFLALAATALLQGVVLAFTGSAALMADTLHNLGDAATALPLGLAFLLARRAPSRRFPYGYGRAEDLAGVVVALLILASAVVVAWESVDRLLHPRDMRFPLAVAAAALVGFAGNEAVARYRMRVGKAIHSEALIADAHHARVDGWTSLAVLGGVAGFWLGVPLLDPLLGLLIAAAIVPVGLRTARVVVARLLDGVEPEVLDALRHGAAAVPGVEGVSEVRARWLGHKLHAEVNLAVRPALSVAQGHAVAVEVRHRLLHDLAYLGAVTVHVDPLEASGEHHHRVAWHAHDGLAAHAHG